MAITANTMIISALGKIQVLGIDANVTAQEAADGLYDLNAMLDTWSIEGLMVYQVQQTTHSWTANAASKTIGSGGDFNTTRPYKIEHKGNFFRDSDSLDYQVGVYRRQDYDRIVDKTATGSTPHSLFYDDGFPTRTLYVHPIPTQALTLYLNSWKPLQNFSALTTELSLPPGYQAAIEWNLAIWSAPRYGSAAKAAARDLEKQAMSLKAAIRGANTKSIVADLDFGGGRKGDIESDT
jgi:hypothetical protein